MTQRDPLIAIVGPTASGKSSLAENVALTLASAVISIDAMQIYKGMDIGTAKTALSERRCPLLMVDVAEIGEAYSARLFQKVARKEIDTLLAAHKTPVLCGGTGLYLNAVIDEMDFPAGTTGGASRAAYEQLAKQKGAEALYYVLENRDPESAKLIHPRNVKRIVRALEMSDEGISYAQQHAGLHTRKTHYDCLIWGIRRDRPHLHQRIEQRVHQMFDAGLVDEVLRLQQQGLEAALTSKQAIGYRQVLDYLNGACTLEEAKEQVIIKTRQYAKRQISWFEHDGRVQWLDFETLSEEEATEQILSAYKAYPSIETGDLSAKI